MNGRIQSLEQPPFRAIVPTRYRFKIFSTGTFDNSSIPGKPTRLAIGSNGFALIFANTFIHTTQQLDDAYFANNNFRDCALFYNGGRLVFMDSNHVINTDLVLGPGVNRDSPLVQQLVKNFQWKSVETGIVRAPEAASPRQPELEVVVSMPGVAGLQPARFD